MTSAPLSDTLLIVPAAGSSRRFGGQDKLLVPLDGVPLFLHCLRTLSPLLAPNRIILPVAADRESVFRAEAERFLPDYPLMVVRGGATRTESVRNALHAADGLSGIRFAAVHDAARPFLTREMFMNCLDAARKYGGAVLCKCITDTVKVADADGFSLRTLDRNTLRRAETPQIFSWNEFREAHEAAAYSPETFTDDAQIMERFSSVRTYLVSHHENNRKITFREDMSGS